MHPAIHYEIAKALIADRQRCAGLAASARAAGQARRALAAQHPRQSAGLARRVLTLFAARGWASHAPSPDGPACPSPIVCASCA